VGEGDATGLDHQRGGDPVLQGSSRKFWFGVSWTGVKLSDTSTGTLPSAARTRWAASRSACCSAAVWARPSLPTCSRGSSEANGTHRVETQIWLPTRIWNEPTMTPSEAPAACTNWGLNSMLRSVGSRPMVGSTA
jgi:hypothetical protein